MSTLPSSAKIVSIFHKSGLHGNRFQHIYIAFAVVEYKDSRGEVHIPNKRNNGRSHAERRMILYLEEQLEKEMLCSQTIKFYVNFSPCSKCSSRIISFLEAAKKRNINIKLEIIVAHLYKIRRPSCLDGRHNKDHGLPEPASHKRNLEGLRKLSSVSGVDLHPFGKDDWQRFASLLLVHFSYTDYWSSGREDEDKTLLDDFRSLSIKRCS